MSKTLRFYRLCVILSLNLGLLACMNPGTTPSTPQPSASQTSQPLSTPTPSPRPLHFDLSTQDLYDETYPKVLVPGLEIEIIAGTGTQGYKDGPGLESEFYGPGEIALDDNGAILITDSGNNRIRKLTPDGTQWVTSTLAGSGEKGLQTGSGDQAKMYYPSQLVRGEQNQYYLSDINQSIYRYSLPDNELHLLIAENSIVEVYQEKGNQIEDNFIPFNSSITRMDYHSPYLYFSANDTIYRLKDGERELEPYMGYNGRGGSGFIDDVNSHFKDGPRQEAYLSNYDSLAFADNGDIYLTDNNRIRKYTAATDAITTLSGNIIPLDFANAILFSRDGTLKDAWFKDQSDILYYSGQGQKDLLLICDEGRLRLMSDQYVTTLTENTSIRYLKQADEQTFYAADANGYIYRIQLDMPRILAAMQDNPIRYYETGEGSNR